VKPDIATYDLQMFSTTYSEQVENTAIYMLWQRACNHKVLVRVFMSVIIGEVCPFVIEQLPISQERRGKSTLKIEGENSFMYCSKTPLRIGEVFYFT
jgi:hypothetical protein